MVHFVPARFAKARRNYLIEALLESFCFRTRREIVYHGTAKDVAVKRLMNGFTVRERTVKSVLLENKSDCVVPMWSMWFSN